MTVKTNIYGSRVAQRILVLFIVASLLPITLFSSLSYRYLGDHLYEQTEKQLFHAKSQFTATINERLHVLSHELAVIVDNTATEGTNWVNELSAVELKKFNNFFDYVILADQNNQQQILFGQPGHSVNLTLNQKIFLQSGDTILDTAIDKGNRPRIHYYRSVLNKDLSKGIIIAKVKNKYLWNKRSLNTPNIHSCIIDKNRHLINCPLKHAKQVIPMVMNAFKKSSYGLMHTDSLGKNYIVSYSALPLESNIRSSQWILVVAKPTTYITSVIKKYVSIFFFIILTSILVVLILSFSQIRRIIIPLSKLQEGTRSIANQKFNTLVNVKSGDEFEELADSFNHMTNRLGKQFNALETMARIDRMILSTLDINNIIETILVRMVRIVPCDTVSIIVINESSSENSKLYYRKDQLSIDVTAKDIELTHDEREILMNNPDSVLIENQGKLPSFLNPLRNNHNSFLLLPIFLQGRLTAAIILGYQGEPQYTPEDLIHARDLAHRVAVALSNAAWEDKLYFKAHYDALTELPNRLLFQDRLQHALTRADRDKTLVALMFIDMDRFKSINDSLGHDAGDDFLIETAKRLRHCVRGIDTVARLGGDEFTIIIPDLSNHIESTTNVASIAQKVMDATTAPYVLANQEVFTSASIGIAIYPNDAKNYTDLLKNSDSAMYFAKSTGKSNYKFYSEELNAHAKNVLLLDNQLHHAIKEQQFILFYQPRIETSTGRIMGVESLIRWNHPEKGLVSPGYFIEVAEETGLIGEIGKWVIEEACRQLKSWHDNGLSGLTVAVNLSANQFRSDDVIQQVQNAIEASGIDPTFLELEITETTLMDDVDKGIEILRKFNDMGVQLSVDDFGTGYSSLNYLKWFPIDALKIDQTFVRDINQVKENAAIVTAVTFLAHSLNLKVIAEGVETEDELVVLRELKCDEIQGYFYSKPLPVDEFEKFYKEHELDNKQQ